MTADPNREHLIRAATLLRPLLKELVFIGGSVTGLLITDPAAAAPRPTFDIDAIAAIPSYGGYASFGNRLRELGFSEDPTEDAPICRWVQQSVTLDLMPLDESILGFSNRWYRSAMNSSACYPLTEDLEIQILTPPYFLATKLEAFRDRGQMDLRMSKDLEDIVSVVDGRPGLLLELTHAPQDVIDFLQGSLRQLLADPGFLDALSGFLLPDTASQSRLPLLLARLNRLSSI